MEEKCNDCKVGYEDEEFGFVCPAPMCVKEWDYDPETRTYVHKCTRCVKA